MTFTLMIIVTASLFLLGSVVGLSVLLIRWKRIWKPTQHFPPQHDCNTTPSCIAWMARAEDEAALRVSKLVNEEVESLHEFCDNDIMLALAELRRDRAHLGAALVDAASEGFGFKGLGKKGE